MLNPTGQGNVGIGTATPGASLDVNGNVLVGATAFASYSGTTPKMELYDVSRTLSDSDSGSLVLYGTSNTAGGGGSLALGSLDNTGAYATFGRIRATKDNGTNGQYGGGLAFDTRANGSGFAQAMQIVSGGQVGIGTSSTTLADSLNVVMQAGGNANGISVSAVNNGGAGSEPGVSFKNASGVVLGSVYGDNGNSLLAVSAGGTTEPITFSTNGGEKMRIAATGNVGIGTTTPTAYLNIKAGTATANTEPLQLTVGVLNTTAVSGALETDASNNLYYTPATATRGIIPLGTAANTLLFTTTGATNVTLPTSGTLATLGSPTFTGTVTIPSPFTLGSTSVTTTGTQFNYLSSATGTTGTTSSNLVFSNSPTLVTPNLGTPSTLVGTNISGTASNLTAGNVTTNANLTGAVTSSGNATSLGSFSSANLLAALSTSTGTGLAVFGTSPSLTTPNIGAATATTINGNTFTTGTYTLTGAAGKTLTFNNSLTFAGTDGSTLNIGTGGTLGTAAYTPTTNYLLATGATIGATSQAQAFTNGVITGDIYPSADSTTAIQFNKANGTSNVLNIDTTNGRVGIGTTTPTAYLNIKAGTATANTEPLQLTVGVLNTTAVSGALETDASNNLYYTPATATRGIIPLGTAANTLLFTTTGATNVTLPTSGTLATLGSPTFTGTVTIPSPFTLGSTSVTTTGTQFNYLSSATGTTGTTSSNLVFSNSPTLVTPNLGTPSTLVGTNISGTASNLTAGNVTTNANLTGAVTSSGNATSLGSFSSANLLAALSTSTGTGLAVFGTSPSLTTPNIGAATATTINGNTFTTGTYTLTGAAGKTLTFNNSLTFAGTDGSTLNIGTGGTLGTAAYTPTTNYLLATGATIGATSQAQAFTNGVITGDIYPSADSTTAIQFNKANGTSNVLNIDTTNGRVGIGTTAPSRKLQVVGGDVYAPVTSDVVGTGSYGGSSFELRNGATSEDLNFDIFNRTTSAWTTPLVIKNQGNVGIGTTSPAQMLQVGTTFYVDNVNGRLGLGTSTPAGGFELTGSHALANDSFYFTTTNDANIARGRIQWRTSQGTSRSYIVSANSYAGNDLEFGTSDAVLGMILHNNQGLSLGAGYAATLAPANGMIVQGNVGIGTVSPIGKLSINQPSGTYGSTNPYLNLTYNQAIIEGHPQDPIVYSNIFIADVTYKITPTKSIRGELQHLSTKQDQGNWAQALLEYSIAPKWFFTVLDMYNYGNTIEAKRIHYYNCAIAYNKGANRFQVSYGKQRQGILCVGGVCRQVPAADGVNISITSSF